MTTRAFCGTDIDAVRRLWVEGLSIAQIAKRVGVSKSTVVAIRDHHGLPPRAPDPWHTRYQDPTPQEIEERCAAIRATWGPERFA